MKDLLFIAIIFFSLTSVAQSRLTVIVSDAETSDPLTGVSVIIKPGDLVGSTDEEGSVNFVDVFHGTITIECRLIGYESQLTTIDLLGDQTVSVELEHAHEHLEEIVIMSTRSSRTFEDIPTRVEFISGEELEEKANMKPGDIRMLLSESTGIQTQQTSATSANASIRIQGLDGRYTQILKDGFPLYAGFSGGLGLLQTPPLDLKQVEVIKGSSSTLYGGGAIAGLVNLVSRTPGDEPELRFFFNGTSAGGLDLNGFYSERFEKTGVTLFASHNRAKAYDPSDVGLSAIPEYERYTINPRVFFYMGEKTQLDISGSFITEDRLGGDMKVIDGDANADHSFFEENNTDRFTTQLNFRHRFNDVNSITFKSSLSYFERDIVSPGYRFGGKQRSNFSEVNFMHLHNDHEWILGANFLSDNFAETQYTEFPLRDYAQNTLGAFIQNNWTVTEPVTIESGLRLDYVDGYGAVLLPRISILTRISEQFTSRLGGGFGYKTPTIFIEETERLQFQRVLPISADDNSLEKSYGINADFNFKHEITEGLTLNLNQLFFYTYLDNPLLITPETDNYGLTNISGFIDTKGLETNARLEYGDFKLFIGYTLTDARINSNGTTVQHPLTPKHRMNNVLMFERHEQWKIGLEAYYFGRQRLSTGEVGKSYWICGFMVERLWEHISLFINFENFLDARQTKFDTIYTGSITDPMFREIYAPLDGFVVNGGIKLNVF